MIMQIDSTFSQVSFYAWTDTLQCGISNGGGKRRIFLKIKCYIFEAISDNIRKQRARFLFCFYFKGQKRQTYLANLETKKQKEASTNGWQALLSNSTFIMNEWRYFAIDIKCCRIKKSKGIPCPWKVL